MTAGWADESAQRAEPRYVGSIQAAIERWGLIVTAAGIVTTGVVLRLYRLGERVLSFDESYTVATAQRSFLDMFGSFRFEANGTLYAIFLWPLLRISESEAVVRAPALVAGLATILAVFWVARDLVGHRAALVASALVAVSPAMIGWSVYARGYAFAILFAVLSFGCLARALDGEERRPARWRGLFLLATLAMAYSSAVAAVTLLPVYAVTVAARAGKTGLRPWASAAFALVMGLLPLAILLHVESTYRDPLAWLWKPDLALVRRVGGELAAGPAFFGDAGAGITIAIAAAAAAIAVTGLVLARYRPARLGWEMRLLVAWALFPPLSLFLVSQIRPMFWGRYLGIIVPALALILAALIVRMPRVLAPVFAGTLLTFLLVASLMAPEPQRDFSVVARWLEAERRSSEPVVVYPIEQLPTLAYFAPSLRIDGDMPVAEWNDTRLPNGIVGYRRDYDWGEIPVGPPTAADLTRLASESGSFRVVTYHNLAAGIPLGWARALGCQITWFDHSRGLSVRGCRTPAP